MFLLSALFVTGVVYVFSAVVAEIVLVSPKERLLAPIVRAGFSLIIALVFFSAAWLVMPAKHAIALGMGLLLIQAYIHSSRNPGAWLASLAASLIGHGRSLLVVLVSGLVFFSPLLISGNLGPFTEGGGDISIYADTAKYLYDRNLTEYGFPFGDLSSYVGNLKDAIGIDMHDRYRLVDYSLLNPPSAESAAYRILLARAMSPFFYAPYAMFGFLAGETNYAVFYGLLALMYGLVLGAIWSFFRPLGAPVAMMAIGLLVSSHGVASVFYNVYAAQSISLAISALILAALPAIRPTSWAGFRIYGSAIVYTIGCYTHFLAIIGPMVLAAMFMRRGDAVTALRQVDIRKPTHKTLLAVVSLLIFIAAMILVVIGGKESATMLLGLVNGAFMKTANQYMGDAAQLFSLRWADFTFGVLSQQHFQPYMAEYIWVMIPAAAAAVTGAVAFLLGLIIVGQATLRPAADMAPYRNYLIVYAAAISICLMNWAVVGASLYTQAKGAQNVLVYLCVALVLPLGIAYRAWPDTGDKRKLVSAMSLALLAFVALMMMIRFEQAVRIGFAEDRSGVTEASFFEEARRIRAADQNPFVLVEPRNSADVYTTIQPFFGARMVPVKHLSLQKIVFNTEPPTEAARVTDTVMVSDLIRAEDLPHLWYVRPQREERIWSLRGHGYAWKAQRFAEIKQATVFYSGNDFEENYGLRPLGKNLTGRAMFSYVRFGSAMLYLPENVGVTAKVRMEARNEANHDEMVKEVAESIANGRIASQAIMESDGHALTLTLKIPPQAQPALLPIARYTGEYWVNVDLRAMLHKPEIGVR